MYLFAGTAITKTFGSSTIGIGFSQFRRLAVQDQEVEMFGYVKTDFPNMYMKDNILYKAMYCGLCTGIGKSCGHKKKLNIE